MLCVHGVITNHIAEVLRRKGANVDSIGDDDYIVREPGWVYYMSNGEVMSKFGFRYAKIKEFGGSFIFEAYTGTGVKKIFVGAEQIHVRRSGQYIEIVALEEQDTLIIYIDPAIDRVKQYAGKYYESVKQIPGKTAQFIKEHPEVVEYGVEAGKTALKVAPYVLML